MGLTPLVNAFDVHSLPQHWLGSLDGVPAERILECRYRSQDIFGTHEKLPPPRLCQNLGYGKMGHSVGTHGTSAITRKQTNINVLAFLHVHLTGRYD